MRRLRDLWDSFVSPNKSSLALLLAFLLLALITKVTSFKALLIIPMVLAAGFAGCAVSILLEVRSLAGLWIRLPLTACMVYGGLGFFFYFFSFLVWPTDWELPMGGSAEVLMLPDGGWVAVNQEHARIQRYNGLGEFTHGWFVEDRPRRMSLGLVQQGTGNDRQYFIRVTYHDSMRYYDLDGKPRMEAGNPYGQEENTPRSGNFTKKQFGTPWYAWPLVSPFFAWFMMIAGCGALKWVNRQINRELLRDEGEDEG